MEDCHSFYQLVQDLEEEGQWVDEKLAICTATISVTLTATISDTLAATIIDNGADTGIASHSGPSPCCALCIWHGARCCGAATLVTASIHTFSQRGTVGRCGSHNALLHSSRLACDFAHA